MIWGFGGQEDKMHIIWHKMQPRAWAPLSPGIKQGCGSHPHLAPSTRCTRCTSCQLCSCIVYLAYHKKHALKTMTCDVIHDTSFLKKYILDPPLRAPINTLRKPGRPECPSGLRCKILREQADPWGGLSHYTEPSSPPSLVASLPRVLPPSSPRPLVASILRRLPSSSPPCPSCR